MDQRQRNERSEESVAASYRRERRPQTLKHTAPAASDRPTSHNLHRETHLGLARSPKKNRTGSTRRDLQPAMPSYGEGRLKIAASNPQPVTVYIHLTERSKEQSDMKRAPPPEKRHQVNKKAERSSEAYPTPHTQSANTKTQTTARLT